MMSRSGYWHPVFFAALWVPLGVVWTALMNPIIKLLRALNLHSHPRTPSNKSLVGKVAIVTGSNSGIGRETAYGLAKRGCTVILACRNEVKGKVTEEEINAALERESKHGSIDGSKGKAIYIQLDLASLSNVVKFVDNVKGRFQSIHILVNNAGLNATGYKTTSDGIDLLMGVNYLAHYLLTKLVLPLMPDSPDSRIVNLSSVLHHFGSINWIKTLKPSTFRNGYAPSKLAMVYLTIYLRSKFKSENRKIRVFAVNPGAVRTEIWRFLPKFLLVPLDYVIMKTFFLDSEQGSMTSIAGACNSFEDNIFYLSPYLVPRVFNWSWLPLVEVMGPFVGFTAEKKAMVSKNPQEVAEALWKVSNEAVSGILGGEYVLVQSPTSK
ncbi:hypothetical protein AAMO2058_001391300 [Amorphochlora amoebiformis]